MNAPFTATFVVDRYLSGVRVDSFLVKQLRNYTAYRMQRHVRSGLVTIDGAQAELPDRVFPGQQVTIRLVEPPDKLLEPEPLTLDVLYEDPWLLVVNKPPGQVVHPVGEVTEGTLANGVQWHLDAQTPLRGLLRPGIVHRLDRETSGTIVIPKDHLSHRQLSIDFQQQRVSKTYVAIVEGVVRDDAGTIDLPLGSCPRNRLLMSCKPDARERKPSRTRYDVLERFAEHTLVQAQPRTGRLHQIRVHFAELGHPVVGDEFYGRFGTIRRGPDREPLPTLHDDRDSARSESHVELLGLIDRHALHAGRIAFMHPIFQHWMSCEAPLPPDMRSFLAALGGARGNANSCWIDSVSKSE